MNPFLRSLLGGQAAGAMVGPDFLDDMERRDATGAIVGNEITVPGATGAGPREGSLPLANAPTFQPEGPLPMVNSMLPSVASPEFNQEESMPRLQQGRFRDDFITGNAKAVSLNRQAEEDTALNSDRKGMFGVKGTLRDILGLVGDAFLVQSGNNAIYLPRRQEEKWSDAMAGFSDGPEAERIAIERAMRIDPGRTQEFLKQSQLNRVNQGNLALRGDELTQKVGNEAMKRSGQIMAAAVATGDPTQIEQAKQAIQQLSTITGIPVEQLMAGSSPELIAGREATASQNLNRPLDVRKVEAAEDRVDIARGQLGVAMRNAASREAQIKIAREALGLRASAQEVDQFIDFLTLPGEVAEQRSRIDRNNRSNRGDNRSGKGSKNRTWTIRPAGN